VRERHGGYPYRYQSAHLRVVLQPAMESRAKMRKAKWGSLTLPVSGPGVYWRCAPRWLGVEDFGPWWVSSRC
jgi:hypothetical protein